MTIIGSDSDFRDAWLRGAARAFFVSAYAEYVEEAASNDNDLTDEQHAARKVLPRASNGGNWEDVAPETPPAAYALAGELWALLERDNGCNVYALAKRAAQADDPCERCDATGRAGADPLSDDCAACDGRGATTPVDAEAFGSDLAMEAMGHGVSWFDDHNEFDLKVPDIECSQCTFSDDAYKPKPGTIAPDREKAIYDGVQDLLASETWKADRDDLGFATGYVGSYVRQVTGRAINEEERGRILDTLLLVLG